MRARFYMVFLASALICGLLPAEVKAQSEERAQSILGKYRREIVHAANALHISPRLLASIVYAERSLNVRPGEDLVDAILARTGHNSSVGVAQVKVETARWVRECMIDGRGPWYVDAEVARLFTSNTDEQSLIDSLSEPMANLIYAAAYVAMIERHWGSMLGQVAETADRVALIGTLYSLGLQRPDSTLREPHPEARPNSFGRAAAGFHASFLFSTEFPQ